MNSKLFMRLLRNPLRRLRAVIDRMQCSFCWFLCPIALATCGISWMLHMNNTPRLEVASVRIENTRVIQSDKSGSQNFEPEPLKYDPELDGPSN